MRLYLVQHGEAKPEEEDPERPLTDRGASDVRRCLEPRMGPEEVALQWPAAVFFPDAATDAFLGLPGALVWDLVAS